MHIGTLAKETGLAQSRIRYYEAQGLLGPVQRSANGYRHYQAATLHILAIITTAQEAGFSLDEIRQLLPQQHGSGWDRDRLRTALRAKLDDIAAMQARLARTQADLETLLARIEQGSQDDCFGTPALPL